MKSAAKLFSSLVMIISMAALAGCTDADDKKTSAPAEKSEATKKPGVTVDAEMMGLKIEPVSSSAQNSAISTTLITIRAPRVP